jgi:hypothetical protein
MPPKIPGVWGQRPQVRFSRMNQKNLVLVAEDGDGKKAITFARRCWKDGTLAPTFCSDHVNDGTMALTHGPFFYPWIRHPSLPTDVAGDTWDGGPLAALPLVSYQSTAPSLESDLGKEEGSRFDQVPLLEFSDEGALAVSSPRTEVFDDRVINVVNPWNTFGPIGGPSRLMEYVERYREWVPPTVGVPQTGWTAPGVREGGNAYVPLYVDYAERTHVVAGHPVIAGPEGKGLFIQVTKVAVNLDRWHVSVNNPTDRPIQTTLRRSMPLAGLDLPDSTLTLQPGEYRLLQ